MLLIHARGMVNVRIYFSDVVIISVWNALRIEYFLPFVQEDIEIPFSVEVLQSLVRKRLALTIGSRENDRIQISIIFT